jgi:hypothetical protein
MFDGFTNIDINPFINNVRYMFKCDFRSIAHKYCNMFKGYDNLSPLFSKQDFAVLTKLRSNLSIHITKPGKGNGVVIIDKQSYIDKIDHLWYFLIPQNLLQ